MTQEIIKIYADGSCIGNPWPGGYAAILMYKENLKTISGWEPDTTNNRMELKAVIKALESLKAKNIPIEIYVDSKYVYDWITKYIHDWVEKNWKTSTKQDVKNIDLWKELSDATNGFKITWNWVKAHSDNHMNNLVDKLARKEANKLVN